jgi:adenylate cyclase class 2
VLTFKGPKQVEAGIRSREEIETVCADGKALLAILGRLGYAVSLRYQKLRETWELEGGAHVVLDRTPLGDFLEIEATLERVKELIPALGIAEADVVADTYPALFLRLLEERGDRSREVLFDAAG